jgi:hypothetical protein
MESPNEMIAEKIGREAKAAKDSTVLFVIAGIVSVAVALLASSWSFHHVVLMGIWGGLVLGMGIGAFLRYRFAKKLL